MTESTNDHEALAESSAVPSAAERTREPVREPLAGESSPLVPVPWRTTIGGLLGTSKAQGIPPAEVVAAYQFIEALRADLLDQPPTAADETTLASIARVSLLELRLSRQVFKQGAVRRSGDVRPAVGELRALIRLKSDLLQRLTFKRGRRDVPSLQTIIGELSASETATTTADVSEVVESVDRAALAACASGATS